VLNRKFPFL